MPYKNWNIKDWSEQSQEWLLEVVNKQLFWDEPHEKLNAFLDGNVILPGIVASKLGQIATWFTTKAEALSLNNPSQAIESINVALQYQLLANKLFIAINSSDKRPRKQGKMEFNGGAICLARLISFGHFQAADSLFSEMFLGLRECLFYGVEATSVAPFIFDLYAKWKGVALSLEKFGVKRAVAYDNLLSSLEIQDISVIIQVLQAACDYHVERSQPLTDQENFEFDQYLDRIYPAEILAFLRLRQKLGLPVPEVKHQIFDNPLAKLHEPKPFPDDPFLNRITKAVDVVMLKQGQL